MEARLRHHSPFLYTWTASAARDALGRTASSFLATFEWDERCLLQDGEGWSFTFGPGHRCTFNASQPHQVDQLVWSGTVAGLFVNGTNVTYHYGVVRCTATERLYSIRS